MKVISRKIENLEIFDYNTKEKCGEIKDIKTHELKAESNMNIKNKALRFDKSFNGEFYVENGNLNTNINEFLSEPEYKIKYLKIVQARKHKKKRINKKWIKRYGYKAVWVTTKGWNFIMKTDRTYEFLKD